MGEIVRSSQMDTPVGRAGLASGQTHRSSTIVSRELQYGYAVNGKHFLKTRISNALIFPNPIIEEDNTVKVYYNRFFNGYSILVKLNFFYIMLNLIPQFILVFILVFIKKVYIKETKFLDLLKNYFKSLK